MNAEKIVKKEAKQALSGNWVVGIVSVMVLCFIPVIAMLVVDIAYALAYDVSDSIAQAIKSSPQLAVFFVVFHLLAVVTVLLLSPLMNGFVRVFSSLSEKKTAEISDLFYFFDSKVKYIKSVKFMTSLIVRAVLIFIVSEIPAIIIFAFAGDDKFMLGMTVIFAVLGILATACVLHRYVFALMLFSYQEMGAQESFYMGAQISKKYCKSLIKLTLTFIPWLLLTFFVIPFIYVYPYMTCSYFVSAKYLYQQYVKDVENTITANGMIPTGAFANSTDASVSPIEGLVNYVSETVVSQSEFSRDTEQSKVSVVLKKENNENSADSSVVAENNETDYNSFTQENSVAVAPDEGGKVTDDL